jgi:hypothetical protein
VFDTQANLARGGIIGQEDAALGETGQGSCTSIEPGHKIGRRGAQPGGIGDVTLKPRQSLTAHADIGSIQAASGRQLTSQGQAGDKQSGIRQFLQLLGWPIDYCDKIDMRKSESDNLAEHRGKLARQGRGEGRQRPR